MDNQIFVIGNCGDAWKLRCIGDSIDIVSHRPYGKKKNQKTPIGLCCDVLILVLYPENDSINWEKLLDMSLSSGKLCSGVDVKVIYLFDEDYFIKLPKRKRITLAEIKQLAEKSEQAFKYNKNSYEEEKKQVQLVIDKIFNDFRIEVRRLSVPGTIEDANEMYDGLKRLKEENPYEFEEIKAIGRI